MNAYKVTYTNWRMRGTVIRRYVALAESPERAIEQAKIAEECPPGWQETGVEYFRAEQIDLPFLYYEN